MRQDVPLDERLVQRRQRAPLSIRPQGVEFRRGLRIFQHRHDHAARSHVEIGADHCGSGGRDGGDLYAMLDVQAFGRSGGRGGRLKAQQRAVRAVGHGGIERAVASGPEQRMHVVGNIREQIDRLAAFRRNLPDALLRVTERRIQVGRKGDAGSIRRPPRLELAACSLNQPARFPCFDVQDEQIEGVIVVRLTSIVGVEDESLAIRRDIEFADAEVARMEQYRPLLLDVDLPELLPKLLFVLHHRIDLALAGVLADELNRLRARLRREAEEGLAVRHPVEGADALFHVGQPLCFAALHRQNPDLFPMRLLLLLFTLRRRLGHVWTGGEEGDPAPVRRPARRALAFVTEGDLAGASCVGRSTFGGGFRAVAHFGKPEMGYPAALFEVGLDHDEDDPSTVRAEMGAVGRLQFQ